VGDRAGEVDVAETAQGVRAAAGATALAVDGLACDTLKGVSFHVDAGEIVGLAGLIGSGRDDLPAAVTGLMPATANEVRVGTHSFTGRVNGAALRRAGVV